MGPIEPNSFMLYYAGGTILVLLLLFWKRPRRGMRLRLKGRSGGRGHYRELGLNGKISPDMVLEKSGAAGSSASGERSINVVFNYNGHSWDAYEVLGVPAGSSFEVVEAAYKDGLSRMEGTSRPFVEAAFQAIKASVASGSRAG